MLPPREERSISNLRYLLGLTARPLNPVDSQRMEHKARIIKATERELSAAMSQNLQDIARLLNGRDEENVGEFEFNLLLMRTLIRLRIFMPTLPDDLPRVMGGKLACHARARSSGCSLPCAAEMPAWIEQEMRAVQFGSHNKALCVVMYNARVTIDRLGVLPHSDRMTVCDLRADPILRYLYHNRVSFQEKRLKMPVLFNQVAFRVSLLREPDLCRSLAGVDA